MTNTKFHFKRLFYKAMDLDQEIGGEKEMESLEMQKKAEVLRNSALALSLSEGVTLN